MTSQEFLIATALALAVGALLKSFGSVPSVPETGQCTSK